MRHIYEGSHCFIHIGNSSETLRSDRVACDALRILLGQQPIYSNMADNSDEADGCEVWGRRP